MCTVPYHPFKLSFHRSVCLIFGLRRAWKYWLTLYMLTISCMRFRHNEINLMIIITSQNVHKICFWVIWMTFKYDLIILNLLMNMHRFKLVTMMSPHQPTTDLDHIWWAMVHDYYIISLLFIYIDLEFMQISPLFWRWGPIRTIKVVRVNLTFWKPMDLTEADWSAQ